MQIHDTGMIRGEVCILYFVFVVCFEIFDLFVCEVRYYYSAYQSTKDPFHTGSALCLVLLADPFDSTDSRFNYLRKAL